MSAEVEVQQLQAASFLGSIKLHCEPTKYVHDARADMVCLPNENGSAAAFLKRIPLSAEDMHCQSEYQRYIDLVLQKRVLNKANAVTSYSSTTVAINIPSVKTPIASVDSDRFLNASLVSVTGATPTANTLNAITLLPEIIESSDRHYESAEIVSVGQNSGSPESWELSLLELGILRKRMIFSNEVGLTSSSTPFALFSLLTEDNIKSKLSSRQHRLEQSGERSFLPFSLRRRQRGGVSYAHLLRPHETDNLTAEVENLDSSPSSTNYSPFILDDPLLKSGKHRVVLHADAVLASVIQYVNKAQLKRELNVQFRNKHDWLEPSMSLSKIRRCKNLLYEVGIECDLEHSTTALAYVYFEKCCLQNIVTKQNRKLVAAVALVLAYKYNEHRPIQGLRNSTKGTSSQSIFRTPSSTRSNRRIETKVEVKVVPNDGRSDVRKLLDSISRVLGVKRSEVLKNEFYYLTCLSFDLNVSADSLEPHLQQIWSRSDHVPYSYWDL